MNHLLVFGGLSLPIRPAENSCRVWPRLQARAWTSETYWPTVLAPADAVEEPRDVGERPPLSKTPAGRLPGPRSWHISFGRTVQLRPRIGDLWLRRPEVSQDVVTGIIARVAGGRPARSAGCQGDDAAAMMAPAIGDIAAARVRCLVDASVACGCHVLRRCR